MTKVHHISSAQTRRKARVRSKLSGTAKCPRITVYRSNRYISVQAIDDTNQKTLCVVSDRSLRQKKAKQQAVSKTEYARVVGQQLADKLQALKIKRVIFDRGAYRYHGRVKMVAEALREQGVNV